ncbi:hypothetical protein [Pontibacter oryzae]|uniref:PsbP C-terminal domain-containing protein n=1 Tax=Pontibacter oryzae TaxID=2304593 RepID=A0A399RP49_9BACT|nr:hypothetical protein [Pontibacter oryzae]RIJ33550.1 hypothetical protein D1627_18235 [Pontibacter oryzae]
MNKLFTVLLALLSISAYGQVDQSIWDNLKTISTENYEIKFPSKWRHIPTGGQGPEQLLEASGQALPAVMNGSPVMVTIFFVKQDGKNLDDCKDKCLNGYRTNPDREFPERFIDGQEKIKLTQGEEAYMLNTRFYRKSKGLNQSRFDLVVYSDKAKAGYIYTVSIQYADNSYKFEKENNLADFARRLYSYLKLTV